MKYVYITPGDAETYARLLGDAAKQLAAIKADRFLVGQLRNLKAELLSPVSLVEAPDKELYDALVEYYNESDGITVGIPSELVQALLARFREAQ
jgi:hypothetical protein